MFRQPPFSMAWSRRVTTPIVHTAQGAPQAATVARLEQALSTAMAHYLMDRHQGRIDPKKSSATSTHCARPLTRRPTCIRRWRPGVPLADLHKAALSLRVRGGGVGFYPRERLSISIRAGCATGEAGQCAQATPLMKVG